MLSRTGAAIIFGVLLMVLVLAAWSLWFAGPIPLKQVSRLSVYRLASASNLLIPVDEWLAGTGESEAVLREFARMHNHGVHQEQNLTGRPDYVMLLRLGGVEWVFEVFGEWFRVNRPNSIPYTLYAADWGSFRQKYLQHELTGDSRIPFDLGQVIDEYMHERMSTNLVALAGYVMPQAYYQLSQLAEQAHQDTIRGYEVKNVTEDSGRLIVQLRVFGTQPTATWEEEYATIPMAGSYKLSLLGRMEYVVMHP